MQWNKMQDNKESAVGMEKSRKLHEDELTIRQKKAVRKTVFHRVLSMLAALAVTAMLLLRWVFGVAYCREQLPSAGIPAHSGILYCKLLRQYGSQDIIVYRDDKTERTYIKCGADYETLLGSDDAGHIRMEGKVIWHFQMEGF